MFQVISNCSIKAFHFNGLCIGVHPKVYEPAEDTFQLLEAIKIKQGETVLEIGTGCGIIALECARQGSDVISTDLNLHAVNLARRNVERNSHMLKGNVEVRSGDIFSALQNDERFDVVIFNPPYLPTRPHERIGKNGWFDLAIDGGVDGLAITERFIEKLPKVLLKNGRAYFVFSSLSDRVKLTAYLNDNRLESEILLSRRFDDELIDIYCVHFYK